MGTPQDTGSAAHEPLDQLLHRLAEMLAGRDSHDHDHQHAETVEGSVRRIETGLPLRQP